MSHRSTFPKSAATRSLTIVLIGGTGFVGSQLAPVLTNRGHRVIIASRNAEPAHAIVGRDSWENAIDESDIVVLLSVVNNDVDESFEAVRSVNVDLPLELLSMVATKPNKHLVLFGSDHAGRASGAYASTKAELVERLRSGPAKAVTILTLSPVHGSRFVKKLAFVDYFPGPLRSIVVTAVGALRPLTHVNRIAEAIETVADTRVSAPIFIPVVDEATDNLFYRVTTRIFDFCFAAAVLLLFGWLMLIIAVLVAVTSPGPALFRQQRVGRDGCVYTCFKFRTMQVNTPQVATHQVSANATTRLGKSLRACKLDELPQVFNIIANQMSLVGPRPCLPSQHELVEARQRLGVLAAKPGVTGWSQIQGIDMADPQRLAQSDAEFCARRSISLYLQIVLMTFLGKGQGDRVRRAQVPD